jgi:hypothetical protein
MHILTKWSNQHKVYQKDYKKLQHVNIIYWHAIIILQLIFNLLTHIIFYEY